MRICMIFLCALFACQKIDKRSDIDYVKYYISEYEPLNIKIPAGSQEDIAGSLIKIAADPTEKRFYRERALEALKDYPEDRVLDFLSGWRYEDEPFLSARALSSLTLLVDIREERDSVPAKVLNEPTN